MSYPLDRKLAVEFIGMFLFVFTVGMATESANKSGAILAPIAIGSVLMVITGTRHSDSSSRTARMTS